MQNNYYVLETVLASIPHLLYDRLNSQLIVQVLDGLDLSYCYILPDDSLHNLLVFLHTRLYDSLHNLLLYVPLLTGMLM